MRLAYYLAIAAVGIPTLYLLWYFSAPVEGTEQIYETIVIGAGISGISATDALTQMGYNAIALEAKDRIGGRLWSYQWENKTLGLNYTFDKGASWIHGIKYNPIFLLTEKYGMDYAETILESDIDVHWYYINGQKLTEEDRRYVDKEYSDFLNYLFNNYGYVSYHPFQELTVDRIFSYNNNKELSVEDALKNYFKARGYDENKLDDRLTKSTGINITKQDLFKHVSTYEFVNTWATDISEISAVHYEAEMTMEGVEVIFPNGYDEVAKKLARNIDYRTESPVHKIDWSKDPIKVYVKGQEEPLLTKYVISTLPLGVLQKSVKEENKGEPGFVEFYPKLPEWKINAINKVGMGTMNKIWIIFDDVFWDRDKDIQYWSILNTDPSLDIGDKKDKQKFSFVMNAYESTKLPILLAFHSGETGIHYDKLQKANNLKQIKEDVVINLAALYPEVGEDKIRRSLIDVVVSDWSQDEYTGGSYSFPKKGSTPQDFFDLQREVDGKIFFAGEATELDFWGTVHGAYYSGIRAAEDVDFRYSWDRWHSPGLFFVAGLVIALSICWTDFVIWRNKRNLALEVMGRGSQVAWRGTALVIATLIIIAAVYFWLEMIVGIVPDVFDYLIDVDEECYPIERLSEVMPYMRLTPEQEEVYYNQLMRCRNIG